MVVKSTGGKQSHSGKNAHKMQSFTSKTSFQYKTKFYSCSLQPPSGTVGMMCFNAYLRCEDSRFCPFGANKSSEF